jgi:hypothetical protein
MGAVENTISFTVILTNTIRQCYFEITISGGLSISLIGNQRFIGRT